jgi:hypothetical protein
LKSSDGVVFYVSRFLLAYTSPVFKDILALGPKNSTETMKNPLQFTEDEETLDLLFRHIDPTLPNLPLDKHMIPQLLEAARKYQYLASCPG